MSVESFSVVLYVVLGVVGVAALHLLTERSIFHRTHPLANGATLLQTLNDWRKHEKIVRLRDQAELGWLGNVLEESGLKSDRTLELVYQRRDSMLRGYYLMPMVTQVAPALGLLAGVFALMNAMKAGPQAVSLGLVGTGIGLIIAIPMNVFSATIQGRTTKLLEQANGVLEALAMPMPTDTNDPPKRQRLDKKPTPLPKPPTGTGSVPTAPPEGGEGYIRGIEDDDDDQPLGPVART